MKWVCFGVPTVEVSEEESQIETAHGGHENSFVQSLAAAIVFFGLLAFATIG